MSSSSIIGMWRDHPVSRIDYDVHTDQYVLIDKDDVVIERIDKFTFLCLNPGGIIHGNRQAGSPARRVPATTVRTGPHARTLAGYAHQAGTPRRADADPYADLPHAGFSPRGIVGYRAWMISATKRLHSCSVPVRWEPREPVTGNLEIGNEGVHAWKTEHDASRYADDMVCYTRVPAIVGSVHLWGRVIEHEKGYRAEFAAVRSIDGVISPGPNSTTLVNHQDRLLDVLRARYTTIYEHMPNAFVDAHERALLLGVQAALMDRTHQWDFVVYPRSAALWWPGVSEPPQFAYYVSVTFKRDDLRNLVVTPIASSRRIIEQWCEEEGKDDVQALRRRRPLRI
jgi:hypothetical protein